MHDFKMKNKQIPNLNFNTNISIRGFGDTIPI